MFPVDIGDYIHRQLHLQRNKYLDPQKFCTFTLDGGNIVWGKNWDLIFPIELLHEGVINWSVIVQLYLTYNYHLIEH